jgi:hypothetical protein
MYIFIKGCSSWSIPAICGYESKICTTTKTILSPTIPPPPSTKKKLISNPCHLSIPKLLTKKHTYLSNIPDTLGAENRFQPLSNVYFDHGTHFTGSSLSEQNKWNNIHWICNLIIFTIYIDLIFRKNPHTNLIHCLLLLHDKKETQTGWPSLF